MTWHKQMTGAVGVVLVTAGLSGCVESEASLGVRGVVEFNGTRTTEAVECGSEMNPNEKSKPVLNCDDEIEPGNASNFLGNATVDISDFQQGGAGQLGSSKTVIGEEKFCDWSTSRFINVKYGYSGFELTLDTENRLQDSREVEAQGQGGGGGGFEGLHLNTNDIHLRELIIRFPDASAGDLERTIKLATLAESGGGGASISFNMFDRGDVGALQNLYQSKGGSGSAGETVTVVAEFLVRGETLGERPIESNRFEFPIRICAKGCGTTPRCSFDEEGGA